MQHFDSQTAQQNNDNSLQSVLALLLSLHSSCFFYYSGLVVLLVTFSAYFKYYTAFKSRPLSKHSQWSSPQTAPLFHGSKHWTSCFFQMWDLHPSVLLHLFLSPHLITPSGMSLVSWPFPDPTNSFVSFSASFTTLLGYNLCLGQGFSSMASSKNSAIW